jgi:hypothetical protein
MRRGRPQKANPKALLLFKGAIDPFGRPATCQSDRIDASLSGIGVRESLSAYSISADLRKTILAVSRLARFSHSLGHFRQNSQ